MRTVVGRVLKCQSRSAIFQIQFCCSIIIDDSSHGDSLFLRQSVDYMILNTSAELIRRYSQYSREKLDRMVLTGDTLGDYPPYPPIYVSSNLAWENFIPFFFNCVLYAYTSVPLLFKFLFNHSQFSFLEKNRPLFCHVASFLIHYRNTV